MAAFYPRGLLLLVQLMVMSECREVSSVVAYQEEDVALPCSNSSVLDPKSCYRVRLTKYATHNSQMRVILARPKTLKSPDAERVRWEADADGQMRLLLTKVQRSDEGLYGCEIWLAWDLVHAKNISLKVKECKTLKAVKAAPGPRVNLRCPVNITSGQQGARNVSWVMLKGASPVSIKSEGVEINGTSLAIQSVDYSDSGWYRCMYMVGQTQRCFDVNLLVQEVEHAVVATTVPALTANQTMSKVWMEGKSAAFTAGVASVMIAVAITAALTGLFIYHRRNTQTAAQPAPTLSAGPHTECLDGYESVDFEDPASQEADSLYDEFDDENLCTCKQLHSYEI
ncbi:uncharacterized protein LOC119006013 isoform X1 [Acanthopagrus latus]|uniref:uncharacterized protein LOC119006013 isoform X1 n=1 Tax=Acanthopagrus latus TaxID=8177 RepID=UPI00187C69BC|nr:uncharacterized protein LOC119006013 isoform X1 [Acanthopagrus latus]